MRTDLAILGLIVIFLGLGLDYRLRETQDILRSIRDHLNH